MKHYDAIVIGSGQGGTPLAKKLAGQGLKTAIIEERWIGGTCINDGCTPTKTMIASARMMHLGKRSKAFGVNIQNSTLDFKAVLERKQKIVESFRLSAENGLIETENVELLCGRAFFSGQKELTITLRDGINETITAEKIFINAGARPAVPKIEGLDTVNYLTSTTIMELERLPEHLVIIGGGYIGVEFGQMFRRFGSKVTILEHSERFLSREDEDVSNEIKKFLEDEEIDIHIKCEINKVYLKNNQISVAVNINEEEKIFSGSQLLIGAGRKPNTDLLHLENTGIRLNERGYIIVNEKLETGIEGIYALGDIKGGPEFTHISYNDHLVVYKNLFENGNETITERLIPYCMFTDPQLGRIGITEQEARKKRLNVKVAKLPMKHIARAIETGETTGFLKAVVDADTKKILGAAIIGEQGGELMSMVQLAMMGGITYDVLRSAVFAHPLYAESLNNLFMQLEKDK